MIYCVMSSGKPLSNSVRDVLFDSAIKMVKDERDDFVVVHDDCQGILSTKWDTMTLGFISGFIFNASVNTEQGNTQVTFIVRTQDIESVNLSDGEWFDRGEIEAMIEKARKRASKYREN